MPQQRGLINPKLIRVEATTKSYCSNCQNQIWGRMKGIPGLGESLQEVQ